MDPFVPIPSEPVFVAVLPVPSLKRNSTIGIEVAHEV
jgi:hypothetical protein